MNLSVQKLKLFNNDEKPEQAISHQPEINSKQSSGKELQKQLYIFLEMIWANVKRNQKK